MERAPVERRLTAILAADVAGYSRLVGADEEGTLARWRDHWTALIEPKIKEFQGRVVRITGDGILAEFVSVVQAVGCAVALQRGMLARNADVPADQRIEFRVGVNAGDIIVNADGDVWGEGVNIAARLEALAEPGGICISGRVREDVENKLDVEFEDAGEQRLKNISRPVRVYRARMGTSPGRKPALVQVDRQSIAVLPFQSMSDDPQKDFFADGLVEEITTSLSRVRWLLVIARNSSFAYKGRAVDVKQVGRELGVRNVLEGTVRTAGSRVRVTGQLIDATTGHHVWADRYDREITDVFGVQDEIADRVIAAIEPRLFAVEGARAKRKPPDSLDAWECLVRSLLLINDRTEAEVETARELLQKAVTLDPNYAYAQSLLAFVFALEVHCGWQPRDVTLQVAMDAANKAVRLDPDEPWAHAAMGFVLNEGKRVGEAVAAYERALKLNPNFAYGYTMLSAAYCYLGRGADAMEQIDRAERLSPLDLLIKANRGANDVMRAAACFVEGRHRDGIEFARKAVIENPGSVPARRQLVINYALAGEIDLARAALQAVQVLQPDLSLSWLEAWVPFVNDEDRRKYVDGFRLAGLQ